MTDQVTAREWLYAFGHIVRNVGFGVGAALAGYSLYLLAQPVTG